MSFLVPTLCVAGGHGGEVALPRLLHRPDRGGGRPRRWHLPLQGPHPLRRPHQGGRSRLDGRVGLALDQPDRAPRPPRPRSPARCGHHRPHRAAPVARVDGAGPVRAR